MDTIVINFPFHFQYTSTDADRRRVTLWLKWNRYHANFDWPIISAAVISVFSPLLRRILGASA